MNSQMGFSSKLRRLTAPVCVMIRGELAIGARLRATNLYPVGPFGSWPWCSHAHRRQSSGRRAHSLRRHSVPCHVPVPATSDRQSTVRPERQRECRI